MAFRRGKIQPAGKMLLGAAGLVGARPMAGQLTLDQSIGVRLLCPQLIQGPRQSEGFFTNISFDGGPHLLQMQSAGAICCYQ